MIALTRAARAILATLLLASCAVTSPREESRDPWEGWNRRVFTFNERVDRAVLKPVSEAYVKVVPSTMRRGVSNFFDNLTYINVIANALLQGKPAQAYADTGRFIINTTLGMGGLLDIATPAGVPRNDEDFGQTLGVWGVGEGPYLVLPLLGPSTFRDVPRYVFSALVHPLNYYSGDSAVAPALGGLSVVDQRAQARGAFELIDAAALDRYIFVREAYRQRRLFLIYDGKPPLAPLKPEAPGAEPPLPGESGAAAPQR